MRWDVKPKHIPKPGEIRTVIKFAFTPVLCNKNHKHWLEKMPIIQWYGPVSNTWWDFDCNCPSGDTK